MKRLIQVIDWIMVHLWINSPLFFKEGTPPRTDIKGVSPFMSFPKPMEEDTFWLLPLDFSFIMSSSLEMPPGEPIFFAFLLLGRGGSFLGKANMGKMTRSMAMEHKRKPLHLEGTAGLLL